jgi:hypothetical protein
MTRVRAINERRQCGIRANAVIVTVTADECAVKADISCLGGGDSANFRADEVVLGNSVLLVKNTQDIQLNGVGVLSFSRKRADKDI